jgi:hypothetical protein
MCGADSVTMKFHPQHIDVQWLSACGLHHEHLCWEEVWVGCYFSVELESCLQGSLLIKLTTLTTLKIMRNPIAQHKKYKLPILEDSSCKN